MLRVSFLAVRGLPRPSSAEPSSLSSAERLQQQQQQQQHARWSVRVQHGAQQQCTRPVELPDMQWKEEDAAAATTTTDDPESTTADVSCTLFGDEKLEIEDKEDQETVQIALLVFDVKPATNQKKRESFVQSTATIEMSTFRLQPDKSTTLWLPLRAAAPHLGDPSGAIRIDVTYHSDEDCGAQGYIFALFCGLMPLSWTEKFVFLAREYDGATYEAANKRTYRPWACNKALMIKEAKQSPVAAT